MSIRFARKADCAAIAEIYNHAVLYTAAIWNDQTVDADNRIAWFEARTIAGYPVLVSEEDGVVTGYASFGDWRSFDGFRHTVEHSVYVHPDHQGKGLGRKLLSRLIDEARDCGKHVMVAGIESQNQASLHLHQSLGSFFVFASISGYQNVGAATTIAVLVASQLIGGLMLDIFRSHGVPLRALFGPICGAILLVVGAWLVARRSF